ncbi:hypothetical protein E4U21_003351 [Claviceps maximensis]|nr:hypothetical protein E4U21_003351 [Claviceps maximensis]
MINTPHANALADTHHNCACNVDGKYMGPLSSDACYAYIKSGGRAHWDGYSCVDGKALHGIDGDVFEGWCVKLWGQDFGGNQGTPKGNCWH